jgi:hypothetical protein
MVDLATRDRGYALRTRTSFWLERVLSGVAALEPVDHEPQPFEVEVVRPEEAHFARAGRVVPGAEERLQLLGGTEADGASSGGRWLLTLLWLCHARAMTTASASIR